MSHISIFVRKRHKTDDSPAPAIGVFPRILTKSIVFKCLLIKEGAGILHQIHKFSGGVNIWRRRIHQSKSWYYRVGSSWTLSNIQGGIFYRNCFRLKAINFFFCKKIQRRCLTGSINLFEKTLLCFVSEGFASWKIKSM